MMPSSSENVSATRDFSPPKCNQSSQSHEDLSSPVLFPSSSDGLVSRQLTRGPFYGTLSEAHIKITTRSRSASQHASSDENVPSSDNIPLQELNSLLQQDSDDTMSSRRHDLPAQRLSSVGRSLTDYKHLRNRAATSNLPSSPPPCGGVGSFDIRELDFDSEAATHPSSSEPVLPPHHASGSTVDRIVDQYVPSDPSSEIEPRAPNDAAASSSAFHFGNSKRPGIPRSPPEYDVPGQSSGDDYFFGPHDSGIETNVPVPHFQSIEEAVHSPTKPDQIAREAMPSATAPYRELLAEVKKAKCRWVEPIAPSTAPQISLPQIPRLHPSNPFSNAGQQNRDQISASTDSTIPSMTSVSDTELLLANEDEERNRNVAHSESKSDGGSRVSCLLAPPLRMHSTRSRGRRTSGISIAGVSQGGVSSGNMTQDSDDDPFRYDREEIFVKPSKEREVSAALCYVSGLGRESQATICSPNGTPVKGMAYPVMNVSPVSPGLSRLNHMTNQDGQTHVFKPQAFYDSSAIDPGWSMGSPNVVKVPVRRNGFQVKGERVLKDGVAQQLSTLERLRRENGDHASTGNSEGDWQTEYTSGAMMGGGAGLSFNQQYSSNYIKQTGDSIANVSDCNYGGFNSDCASSYRERLYDNNMIQDQFESSQVGLVHPLAQGANPQDTRYVKKDIKNAPYPIFLPQQRMHRVNGLFQDSSRGMPQPSTSSTARDASSTVSNIVRKVSNSFRRQSTKRPQLQFPYSLGDRRSRYNFADSDSDNEFQGVRASAYHQAKNSAQNQSRRRQPQQRFGLETPSPVVCTPGPKTDIPQDHQQTSKQARVLSGESHSSPDPDTSADHSFQFHLIPLPEAARLQALRRASGQDDHTVTGRAHRNLRFAKSYNSQQTNPATPPSSSRMSPMVFQRSRFLPRHFIVPVSPLAGHEDLPDGMSGLTIGSTPQSTRTTSTGGTYNGEYGPARLYAWDTRHRLQHQRSTDPSLRSFAHRGHGRGGDLEAALRRQRRSSEPWVSTEARAKRNFCFFFLVLLSIFPFVSVMVHFGVFDSALSWHTQGEVGSLTRRQKRFILIEMVVTCILWPLTLILLVMKFTGHHKGGPGLF